MERGAAVDVDGLASDEATIVTDQKQAGGGDLVHPPLTPQWNAGGARHMPLVPLGVRSPCIDAARGDHVDPDVLCGELGSQPPGQSDQTHLRRRDVGTSAAAAEGSFAGEEQDASIAVL